MYPIDQSGDNLQPANDIVDELIGSGRWQLLITILISFCVFTHMLNTGTETIMRPEGWWCKKPDFLYNWTNTEWIIYSHSADYLVDDGYFQGCTVYNINYSQLVNISYAERPPITVTDTIPCPYGIHYSTVGGQSLAEKFSMGCDNSTTVPIVWQSSSVFGRVAGYMIMGILGDWIGRKVVIFISCALSPITALIVATSNYYMVFVVSNAINGFFDGGFSVCLVLILEITSNNRRSEFLIIACCSFALGIESPAWLFCVNKLDELEKVIKKGSKVNGKKSIADDLKLIYVENDLERYKISKRQLYLWNILSQTEIAYEVIGITYLTALYALIFGSSYYSILAAVTKSYIANSLIAFSTLAGMLCGQFCLLLMGHRKILQISIYLVFMSCFMLTINLYEMKPTNTGPTITFLLINVSVVSLSYGVLLNYNVRTVPTLLRGSLSGIWRATWAVFVWIGNHNYIQFPTTAITLILTCIIAGFFSLNIKDLYHRELPDTVLDSSVSLQIYVFVDEFYQYLAK
ncbi:carcinine transporter-like [Microplitis demolitor]|uniref:carcinine transporter-like n=1 Tax=Microplitis demolitor TaxID=69319 RepID=UPI00235B6411|nr:carcinine transporter-like [Microplitis demolitor]